MASGEIRVYKSNESGRKLTLYEIGPGDTCVLNASYILAGISYPANAVTAAKTEVLPLPAGGFRQLLDSYSELQFYVCTMLSQRLTAIMAMIEEIVFNRLDRHLFDYLLKRSENNLVAKRRQNIANDLGTSCEVISRSLKNFAHKGIVRGERNVIGILDNDPPFFASKRLYHHIPVSKSPAPPKNLLISIYKGQARGSKFDPPSRHNQRRTAMKQNVGNIERVIRVVADLGSLSLAFIGPQSPRAYLGIVPMLAGTVGWCPPYALMSFSTCGKCSAPMKQS